MMREYVEKLISDYPKMLSTRAFLKKQIESYVPVTVEDIIDTLTFTQPGGERVQTSNLSDKTCTVALLYRDRVNQMNEEVIGEWVKEYDRLDEEIGFLEHCIRKLPGDLSDVMSTLVLDGSTWDEAEGYLYMSRKTIWSRRQEAIRLLTLEYQKRASRMEAVMLS